MARTIAEATNNGIGVTGLAYGAKIMPLRVLDRDGDGDAVAISRGDPLRGQHGAKVINMSLEFDTSVTASQIPEIARPCATRTPGVVVVGGVRQRGRQRRRLPRAHHDVISVGATTAARLPADYSNAGPGLDLVAPGGGADAPTPTTPAICQLPPGGRRPPIFQETFARDGSVRTFALRGASTRARRWPARTSRPPPRC